MKPVKPEKRGLHEAGKARENSLRFRTAAARQETRLRGGWSGLFRPKPAGTRHTYFHFE